MDGRQNRDALSPSDLVPDSPTPRPSVVPLLHHISLEPPDRAAGVELHFL